MGTNTGDGATVLSNLDRDGAFTWSEGDFNGDGDVDATQLNLFTGEQNGDYAIFLANLGRNVLPGVSQTMMSQPVLSQPVLSQSVSVAPVALPASVTLQENSSVANPISSSTKVASVDSDELTLVASEELSNSEPISESKLIGAQANIDESSEEFGQFAVSNATYSPAELFENSSLELKGAQELLDGIFSGDIDIVQNDDVSDPDGTDSDSFAAPWALPSFA